MTPSLDLRGRHALLLTWVGALIALAGCGSSGGTSSATGPSPTSSSAARTTTSSSSTTTASPAEEKAGAGAPSPEECVAAWNRLGPAPSLKNVLLPLARVSGPFRAEVGSPAGRCAIVVHATGVEGGAAVTYEIAQRSSQGFVQAAVPDLGGSAQRVTLKRSGELSPSR